MKTIIRLNIVVLLAFFIASCGGGTESTALSSGEGLMPEPVANVEPSLSLSVNNTMATTFKASVAVDQCNTTGECKAIYGSGATDCLNSRSNQSICMCGADECAPAVPTPFPTPDPSVIVDQCNTTAECKSIFGNTATDCLNSRSNQSICMCGANECLNPTPVPTATPLPLPTPGPNPMIDQCDTTSECKAIYGNQATDCLNSRSDRSICMCGANECSAAPTPTATPVPTATPEPGDGECQVSGVRQQWHRVAVTCSGYNANENNDDTFTDHRFNVTFTQGGRSLTIPGHFAADGNAADSSASSGNKWRAYFSPPTTGTWQYRVSMRRGDNIVVDTNPNAGQPLSVFNGKTGSFQVTAGQSAPTDMRQRGLLEHKAGERYLRFAGDGTHYVEGGMDSPENIFGFSGFDNTIKFNNVGSCKGILHDFAPHVGDWNNGDPTWKNGRGKGLVGLVNYMSSTGVNAVYIMAMTVNSDGCDAHPWTEYSGNRKAFDVSKLDQWERVLSHMTRKGMMIHLMTQETENDQLLNNGNLGFERKLYYRELISRFGHHPALQWNLGEENTNTADQVRAFARYFKQNDPYQHPVLMHTFPGQHDRYTPLLGNQDFDGPTFQFGGIPNNANGASGVYGKTREWINKSTQAGNTWVVTMTEASGGDAPTPNSNVTSRQRIYWMWANVMAGGAGFEWYLKNQGAGHAYDLAVENLREFDQHWKQSGHLVRFFRDTLQGELAINLQSMQPQNNVTSTNSDWVLADAGDAYLIYLRQGGTTDITLPNNRRYDVMWFNPRTGNLSSGAEIQGPGVQNIGTPPSQSSQDWAAVVVAQTDGTTRHPDIVRIADIPLEDILKTPQANWKDSYSVGDACYCDSTFDHNVGGLLVNTNQGTMTVREACDILGAGPGSAGRPTYNDVQCGNGPANDAGDEDYCPGRVDIGKAGCTHIGPTWKLPNASSDYVERNGLVVMEAENTDSNLDLWKADTQISGFTGAGYLEFDGNSPISGPAKSPLEYRFKVNRGGLYYLHVFAAKEHLTLNGENRTDVANDAYFRLDGDYGAGPNAGGNHQDDAPLSALRSNTKFFGGADKRFQWASGARLDLGGHNNKRVAVYNLKAGQSYTLVMSGRSKFFKVDRIVFRHTSVSASQAQNLSNGETK